MTIKQTLIKFIKDVPEVNKFNMIMGFVNGTIFILLILIISELRKMGCL